MPTLALRLTPFVALALCVACQGTAPPALLEPPALTLTFVGTLALPLEPGATALSSSVGGGPQVRLTPLSFTDIDAVAEGNRYLSVRFRLSNPSSAAVGKLRLQAYIPEGTAFAGTAFSRALDAKEQSSPVSKVQAIVPFAGTRDRAGTVVVDPLTDDLETRSPAQTQALNEAVGVSRLNLLPYGFVARGCGKSSCALEDRLESRTVSAGADAELTVGLKMPRASGNPYRMTLNFAVFLER